MNLYEAGISVLTVTPGMENHAEAGKEAAENPDESQYPWWQLALRSRAGRKVLAELHIVAPADSSLPAEWQVHPLVEPNDRRSEASLPITALALREVLHARAGVMFLERRGTQRGRNKLYLCAIDPEGAQAALTSVY